MTAPSSTYRVQLRPEFGFDDAAAVVPYLAELGVSHVYSSPYLQAAPGSAHGYDVVDHSRVNDDLGGAEAHGRFLAALREHGLGQVLDIVPNHMAIGGRENRWWWDVLENGPSSEYASFFDVDWDPPEAKLRNTVLLPVLGDHYGRVLEAGEIRLVEEGGAVVVRYHEHAAPIAPRSMDGLGSVEEINADPDLLDALLERQHYRLAFWRTARRELDYRRFFDITTLAGLRVEDPRVFDATHDLVLSWVSDGVVDGLRIDHPDGLRDPEGYLRRLRDRAGDAWVVVEKILEPGERLPSTWPVSGTTGYDFLNQVGALFVDPDGEEPLTALYGELTGAPTDFQEVAYEAKHQVMRDVLASDVNRLTAAFIEVCERNRRYRDYSRSELHDALREVIACFPVYRTYGRADDRTISEDDVLRIHGAVAAARERRSDIDHDLLDFLGAILMLRVDDAEAAELAMRFQQLTGPVMAKGVEDTAFYRYNRLVSLNEVGGDPARFGVDTVEFHRANAEAAESWPARMLATSTHDTKRSEDVRARIGLLSEIPGSWASFVGRWMGRFEDANAEYLLYQTLVGAWPLSVERAVAYMEKAAKETKTYTSWVDPNPEYDDALRSFVERLLADREFVDSLESFVAPLVEPGRAVSLSQTLLKLTSPGVPDTYQGTELWDLSLVDPDNRRAVNYEERRLTLRESVPHPKMLVTQRALALRLRAGASYEPLLGEEADAAALAFERDGRAVVVVPRFRLSRPEAWRSEVLALPPGRWRDAFTGAEVDGGKHAVGDVLAAFPVALLVRS